MRRCQNKDIHIIPYPFLSSSIFSCVSFHVLYARIIIIVVYYFVVLWPIRGFYGRAHIHHTLIMIVIVITDYILYLNMFYVTFEILALFHSDIYVYIYMINMQQRPFLYNYAALPHYIPIPTNNIHIHTYSSLVIFSPISLSLFFLHHIFVRIGIRSTAGRRIRAYTRCHTITIITIFI